jgi:hypothetical protein
VFLVLGALGLWLFNSKKKLGILIVSVVTLLTLAYSANTLYLNLSFWNSQVGPLTTQSYFVLIFGEIVPIVLNVIILVLLFKSRKFFSAGTIK